MEGQVEGEEEEEELHSRFGWLAAGMVFFSACWACSACGPEVSTCSACGEKKWPGPKMWPVHSENP